MQLTSVQPLSPPRSRHPAHLGPDTQPTSVQTLSPPRSRPLTHLSLNHARTLGADILNRLLDINVAAEAVARNGVQEQVNYDDGACTIDVRR